MQKQPAMVLPGAVQMRIKSSQSSSGERLSQTKSMVLPEPDTLQKPVSMSAITRSRINEMIFLEMHAARVWETALDATPYLQFPVAMAVFRNTDTEQQRAGQHCCTGPAAFTAVKMEPFSPTEKMHCICVACYSCNHFVS